MTLLDEIGMYMVIGRPTFYMFEKNSSDKIFGIKGEWVMIECMVDAHILSCNVLENVVNNNCFKQFVIQD